MSNEPSTEELIDEMSLSELKRAYAKARFDLIETKWYGDSYKNLQARNVRYELSLAIAKREKELQK